MSLKSSFQSFLRKFLEEDKMTDQTVVTDTAAQATTPVVAATDAAVADNTAADTSATTATTQEVATGSETAPVVATTVVDTDKIKDAVTAAGKDVSAVWDKVVAFAKVADADVVAGIKKALNYLNHEAKDVIDAAVELAKLK